MSNCFEYLKRNAGGFGMQFTVHPMILGCNWKRIYEALDATRDKEQLAAVLIEEEEDVETLEGLDMEGLSNSMQFSEAQAKERKSQAIVESKLARREDEVIDPEWYELLPRFEIRFVISHLKSDPGGTGDFPVINTLPI